MALAAHNNVVCTGPVLGQCGTNGPYCSFWVDRFKGILMLDIITNTVVAQW
jgi:hypothetical protein